MKQVKDLVSKDPWTNGSQSIHSLGSLMIWKWHTSPSVQKNSWFLLLVCVFLKPCEVSFPTVLTVHSFMCQNSRISKEQESDLIFVHNRCVDVHWCTAGVHNFLVLHNSLRRVQHEHSFDILIDSHCWTRRKLKSFGTFVETIQSAPSNEFLYS